MADQITEKAAKAWMSNQLINNWDEYDDCGEANCTKLAEACAEQFEVNDEDGPLDDPQHPLWTWAIEVALDDAENAP